MNKKYKGQLSSGSIEASATIPIVSNAAIATSCVGEGRLIPLLIVDTSNHKHIEDLVNIHNELVPGDVEICWGWPHKDKDTISLILEFKKPVITKLLLNFDIKLYGSVVDMIMTSKALYLQPGRPGDRLGTTMDNPRLLIEVPDVDFGNIWLDRWKKVIYKKMLNQGLNRTDAKKACQKMIEEWRKTTTIRIP